LRLGLDLRLAGSDELSWRRLTVLAQQLPLQPQTALWRRAAGPVADWSLQVPPLLARAVHAIESGNWQRGADEKEGRAKRLYPKPILLPGQQLPVEEFRAVEKKTRITKHAETGAQVVTGKPVPLDVMKTRLGW